MNWVKTYRMDGDLNDEIYQFILNSHGESRNLSFTELKRDIRIEHLLDIEPQEKDDLDYLNQFLFDFIEKIKFISMPVGQYCYLDGLNFMTRNIAVQSYRFESYLELKLFLEVMIQENQTYVFTYKMEPEPTLAGKSQKFSHTLRCFFVNDIDIENWKNSDIKTREEHKW